MVTQSTRGWPSRSLDPAKVEESEGDNGQGVWTMKIIIGKTIRNTANVVEKMMEREGPEKRVG